MQPQPEIFEQRGIASKAAGFSLTELMVTLSIAAVLMAIGIPTLRTTVANNRLSSQAFDLVAALTLSRSQAITLNQPVTLCRADSETATACSGSAGTWLFWIIRTSSGTVVRNGVTQGGSLAVTSTLTDDQIVFTSDGLARTNNVLVSGQYIDVCSDHSTTDNKRQIVLDAGSRVSTIKASGTC
ncbi:MAG TPA: GspH/FimT family pseudopilin [Steroidobacteraceae bacterium]|nr:GspH/FimT family pseudopilin [Steroidobacteraceae bacterium]